jgi:hypothetical protein
MPFGTLLYYVSVFLSYFFSLYALIAEEKLGFESIFGKKQYYASPNSIRTLQQHCENTLLSEGAEKNIPGSSGNAVVPLGYPRIKTDRVCRQL